MKDIIYVGILFRVMLIFVFIMWNHLVFVKVLYFLLIHLNIILN